MHEWDFYVRTYADAKIITQFFFHKHSLARIKKSMLQCTACASIRHKQKSALKYLLLLKTNF
jgi:hypothetical protein